MGKRIQLSDEQYIRIGKMAAKFFNSWWIDKWHKAMPEMFGVNDPVMVEAREIRLMIQREKKIAKLGKVAASGTN